MDSIHSIARIFVPAALRHVAAGAEPVFVRLSEHRLNYLKHEQII